MKTNAGLGAPEIKRMKLEGVGPSETARRLSISPASVYRALEAAA